MQLDCSLKQVMVLLWLDLREVPCHDTGVVSVVSVNGARTGPHDFTNNAVHLPPNPVVSPMFLCSGTVDVLDKFLFAVFDQKGVPLLMASFHFNFLLHVFWMTSIAYNLPHECSLSLSNFNFLHRIVIKDKETLFSYRETYSRNDQEMQFCSICSSSIE